jgi:hypothetical protein
VCSRCHNGTLATKEQVTGKLSDKDPIPFMRRRGWMVGAGAFALLLGVGAYAANEGAKETAERLATPQIGDIYVADLSSISDSFDNSPTYGAMKLIAIDKDSERFVIAHTGYSRRKELRRDIYSDRVRNDDYYDADDTVDLPAAKVAELSHRGVIYQIIR